MDYNPDCPAWGNLTWPKVGEFDLANGVSSSKCVPVHAMWYRPFSVKNRLHLMR